jgi:hypothetical protein
MGRGDLSDAEWELIGPLLPPEGGERVYPHEERLGITDPKGICASRGMLVCGSLMSLTSSEDHFIHLDILIGAAFSAGDLPRRLISRR